MKTNESREKQRVTELKALTKRLPTPHTQKKTIKAKIDGKEIDRATKDRILWRHMIAYFLKEASI